MKVKMFKVGQELFNSVNPNQFGQNVFKGDLDLSIMRSGVITGAISQNESGTLYPGQRVKLDTSAGVGLPQFVAAAITEASIGTIKRAVNKSAFVKGDACEIVYGGGPVMWEEAGGAISAGGTVEGTTGQKVIAFSSGSSKKKGVAIDAAAASGDLIRVIQIEPYFNA